MDLEAKAKAQRQELQLELSSLDQRKRDLHLQIDVLDRLLGEDAKDMKLERTRTALVNTENLFAQVEEKVEGSVRRFCVKILDEDPTKYFTAMEMTDELLRRGFKTTAKKFKNSVKSTLNWLKDNNKIKSKEGNNIRLYTSINNPEN